MSKVVKKLNDYLANFRSYSKADKPLQLGYTEVKEITKMIESCRKN